MRLQFINSHFYIHTDFIFVAIVMNAKNQSSDNKLQEQQNHFFIHFMSVSTNNSNANSNELCTACHKFFGAAAFNGLCSGCHKNVTTITTAENIIKKIDLGNLKSKKQTEVKGENLQEEKKVQADKKKCFSCHKKVGYLGIQCKCSFVFCNAHRLPQEHECEFNHKLVEQKRLKQKIFKVENHKIEEI